MAKLRDELMRIGSSLQSRRAALRVHGIGFQAVVAVLFAFAPCAASQTVKQADALNIRVEKLFEEGKYSEAIPIAEVVLAIRERTLGPEHPDVAVALNNLAGLRYSQGRYGDAEPLFQRSLAIREKALGTEHPQVAQSLHNLASLYRDQGRYADAEPLFSRYLAISEKALGSDNAIVAAALSNLAALHVIRGRYVEAEPLLKRSLDISENALGLEHAEVAVGLNNLAELYRTEGRYAEAEPLYKRSLIIFSRSFGPEHANVADVLNNLAEQYSLQGRFRGAETLFKRSLAIREKAFGPEHSKVSETLNNLSGVYGSQGRYGEAEPLLKRSLAIDEKALGPEHPKVVGELNNLAELYVEQGRYVDAEPLYKRALAISTNALGAEHPTTAIVLANLGKLALAIKDNASAADYLSRATAIIKSRTLRGLGGESNKESQKYSHYFEALVKTEYLIAAEQGDAVEEIERELFETAQWGRSSKAASSLNQMTIRSASGSPALVALVREHQDLADEWQGKDKLLVAAKGLPPSKRDASSEKTLSDRLSAIDARLGEIDARFAREFSEYASLTNPKPSSVADVQAQLAANEALVLFYDTDDGVKPLSEETFVWAVTKTEVRLVRSKLGTSTLMREVEALRCGLDRSNWTDATSWPDGTEEAKQAKTTQLARRERCKELTTADISDMAAPPFDLARAYDLYQALFGQIEDMLKEPDGSAKQLLLVPSGPLTKLPFHVLVTQKPLAASAVDYANAAWLARRNAITVLPSVASLKALRGNVKGNHNEGKQPFVGFGNPLLVGRDGKNKSAWAKQSCPRETPNANTVLVPGWTLTESFAKLFRGDLANVTTLRLQVPLPETADELCAVARELGASESNVYLGARASETGLKQLNAEGALTQARVVHFATHGLIAGETKRIAGSLTEPALVLTPPDIASARDDGLLTASEVTELRLNADWVILSACNTAAGGEKGDAEALSGLARAFFYAGARALLVSHWYVDSHAAVKITTGAFVELKRDPAIGRAEALRRAMLVAMTDNSRPNAWTPAAHPSVWAPFVVVGEGGSTR